MLAETAEAIDQRAGRGSPLGVPSVIPQADSTLIAVVRSQRLHAAGRAGAGAGLSPKSNAIASASPFAPTSSASAGLSWEVVEDMSGSRVRVQRRINVV